VICISEKQNIFSDGAGQGGQINAWAQGDLPVGSNYLRPDRRLPFLFQKGYSAPI
jgi:hypothetical protein